MTRTSRVPRPFAREHLGSGLLGRLRNPAYTGANRCIPCTGVNLGLTAGAALAAGVVSAPLGLAVAAAGVTATALRGYVVPGTPALTKRYLPDSVLAWFDKAPTNDVLGGIDAEAYFRDAGVVVDGPDGDISVPPSVFDRVASGVSTLDTDEAWAA